MCPRARWREREGHHAPQIEGRVVVREIPSVGQLLVRLAGIERDKLRITKGEDTS